MWYNKVTKSMPLFLVPYLLILSKSRPLSLSSLVTEMRQYPPPGIVGRIKRNNSHKALRTKPGIQQTLNRCPLLLFFMTRAIIKLNSALRGTSAWAGTKRQVH